MADNLFPIDPETGEKIDEAFDLNGDTIGSGDTAGFLRVVDGDGEPTGEGIELPDGTVVPSGAEPVLDLTAVDLNGEETSANLTVNGKSFVDIVLDVATSTISGVGSDAATVEAELTDLEGVDSADVYIEYRQTGTSSWTSTSAQTLSSTGAFSADLSGLSSDTEYEARAVATADAETTTGSALTFTTDAAIPDSVDYQWSPSSYSTGDASWVDEVQSASMSIQGDPQKVTMSDGSEAVEGDGSDDAGLADLTPEFFSNAWAIEFELEYVSGSEGHLFGLRDDGSNFWFFISLDEDEAFNTDDGNITVNVQDSNGNQSTFAPSTNPGLGDGSKHTVSVIAHDTTLDDYEIIIDGTSVSLNHATSGGPSPGSAPYDMAFWANNDLQNGTGPRLYTNAALGVNRWHSQAISGQTL